MCFNVYVSSVTFSLGNLEKSVRRGLNGLDSWKSKMRLVFLESYRLQNCEEMNDKI